MEDENVDVTQPEVTETGVADDDFFDEIDKEVIKETSNSEEESKDSEEDTNDDTNTEEETDESKVDFKPLLEELSKKIKYNKESVNIENIDDLISTCQKGLNYDKKVGELDAIKNSKAETYIAKKAKELGLTPDEYMDQVEEYEREQERQKEREKLDEMIENGVPEDIAKEVIATGQLRKQLQAEKNELEEREKQRKAEEDKNREFEEFYEAYPNVKAEDIPKEVFLNAQNSSLKEAYNEWRIADLEKKLSIKETNEKNQSSSVGSVNDSGTTKENKPKDPFMEGFETG